MTRPVARGWPKQSYLSLRGRFGLGWTHSACALLVAVVGQSKSVVGSKACKGSGGRSVGQTDPTSWWARQGSNLHGLLHWILSPTRLPIPPRAHPALIWRNWVSL